MEKVSAIRWHEIDDIRLDTIELPKLNPDQVLVKNLYGGICGSDRHAWHHGTFIDKDSGLNYPAILGHEGSGRIVEIGKDVECDAIGKPIKIGDLVAYHDAFGCGTCMFCRQGTPNICNEVKLAAQKPGIFAQYYPYFARQLISIEGVSPKQGALIEPASTTLHANREANVKIGDTVLVIGAGPIGLFRVQMLKNQGAVNIIVAEVEDMKRRVAKELGADIVVNPKEEDVVQLVMDMTNGYGADVVFEDVGLPELQLMALDAARPHGTVMLMGISTSPITLNFFDRVQLRELTIKGSIAVSRQWDRRHDYNVVADLISRQKVLIDPIITHEYPIEQYEEAFRVSDDSANAIKVVLKIQ